MEKKYRKVSTKGLAQTIDFSQYPAGFGIWYRACLQGAMRREFDFRLTVAQAFELSQSPCCYCERKGVNKVLDFSYVGLDRIDNSKGYTFDNVLPCCKTCNAMKGKMPPVLFLRHISRIAETIG